MDSRSTRRAAVAGVGVAAVGSLAGCMETIDGWRAEPSFAVDTTENKSALYDSTGLVPMYVIVTNEGDAEGLASVTVTVFDADSNEIGQGVSQAHIPAGSRYRVPMVVDIHTDGADSVDITVTTRS